VTAMKKKFATLLHREEDMYVAKCPEIGTASLERALKRQLPA